jgi:hypothetical protein
VCWQSLGTSCFYDEARKDRPDFSGHGRGYRRMGGLRQMDAVDRTRCGHFVHEKFWQAALASMRFEF